MSAEEKYALKIDDDFKRLLPPQSAEEKQQLKQNLENEGWRENEAIITWEGYNIILDGHHRYKLCQELNITDFKVTEKYFPDKNAAKIWIINNQKGRRNLTDGWKWELAQVKRELLKKEGRENKVKAGKEFHKGRSKDLSESDKTFSHNTRQEVAKELGWSTGKVAQAEKVWNKGDDDLKEEIKAGNKSIHQAYTEIKMEEKRQERKKKIEEQKKNLEEENIEAPSGLFDVIVVDPPWQYHKDEAEAYDPEAFRGTAPYPTMSIEELKNIELPAKEDCVLWLWTTHKFMRYAFELLDQWGFEEKAIMTWVKNKMGIGRWLRSKSEFCIMAVKGSPIIDLTNQTTVLEAKVREHSEKPKEFYEMVDDLCPGRKLDYFARQKREGWSVYGDEVVEK